MWKFGRGLASCGIVLWAVSVAAAQDHRVEPLDAGPPSDELSADIVAQLSPTGVKIVRGESRTVCELWFVKAWSAKAGFSPTPQVLYPFEEGQLIGVVRFPRKGADFRDQDIAPGVYTLRYALQPVDGAHVGTSPTRDFVLLVAAANDQTPAPLAADALSEASAEAAGSNHPAMLCLQRPADAAPEQPQLSHDADHDWWALTYPGVAKSSAGEKPQPLRIVVVGVAAE